MAEILTPYQIADRASSTREINRLFRAQDDSHLYPINGRFNVTERAIRRTRAHFRECGLVCDGLEYCLALDAEMFRIVNSEEI